MTVASAIEAPRPVEEWIRHFGAFTDEAMLRPDYAVSRLQMGYHCKLCDRYIKGSWEQHLRAHATQLASYRSGRREQTAREAAERLAALRVEKAQTRAASMPVSDAEAPAASRRAASNGGGISPEKRAYNRITSLRYRLNHPEKSGKTAWSEGERAEIQTLLDQATEAHAALTK